MRYRVGDKVKIRQLKMFASYTDENGENPLGVVDSMHQMSGQIVEISRVFENRNAYFIKEDRCNYLWNDAMLLPAKQNRYTVKGGFKNN